MECWNAGMLERNDILAPVTLSYSTNIYPKKETLCTGVLQCYSSVWIIAPIKI